MRALASTLALLAFATPALFARIDLLLVPPDNDAAGEVAGEPGLKFTLCLNNPTAFNDTILLPLVIDATCSAGGARQSVQLEAIRPVTSYITVLAATRVDVELRLKTPLKGAGGFVSLRLDAPASNAIMFRLKSSDAAPPVPRSAPIATAAGPIHEIDLATDLEGVSRHLSAYEPIYFALGWRDSLNARFQFSFKYRFLEERPDHEHPDFSARWPLHLARDLHFAYTQVSLWDLGSASKPFYDSSYKPALFLLHRPRRAPFASDRLATILEYGVQHESNGRAGDNSRSVNSLYAAPTFRWDFGRERFLEARPRLSAYFAVERENRDLARYRGYAELTLRTGLERGWQLALHARGHPRGHGSVQFDFTLPVTRLSFLRFLPPSVDPRAALGGYVQVQYFNGYGETLLGYNRREPDQLRLGFTLVRESATEGGPARR